MKQKDIWLINLDPTVGAETRKTRQCVILNDDSTGILPLKIVAPLTDFKAKFEVVPWMVKLLPDNINNLVKASVIDVFQVRSVSKQRLIKQIGRISDDDLSKVLEAVKVVFGMK